MFKKPQVFSKAGLDRASALRKDEAWVARQWRHEGARVLITWQSRNLMAIADQPRAVYVNGRNAHKVLKSAKAAALLGVENDAPLFAADVSDLSEEAAQEFIRDIADEAAGRAEFTDLRPLGATMDAAEAAKLGYAKALMHWHTTHHYCGRCGAATQSRQGGLSRRCTNSSCNTPVFPRTDPAVIMLVVHPSEKKALLAHNRRWPKETQMYSTLAGFVDPGESLEEAVAREVMEEVGLPVSDIEYLGSQPWPFPAQIMLGFIAKAESADIELGDDELHDAQWFTPGDIRDFEDLGKRLPFHHSIARSLINHWLDED